MPWPNMLRMTSSERYVERKMADLKLRETLRINENPDMFISVHVNAIPQEKWRGSQVFYHAEGDPNGEFLAKAIQESFLEI